MMSENDVFQVVVDAAAAGRRLDRYLADTVAHRSRSYIRQLIDAGHVQVNQQPVRASYPVQAGDRIRLECPPPRPTTLEAQDLPLDVVYADPDVLVVNKPAGMVVHPAPGHRDGTLVNALLAHYPEIRISGDLRPGIVHRLDQGTSGLLVVARNDRAWQMLSAQQKRRDMLKAYLAVVEGRFKEPEGLIDAPIGRHPGDRKRQAVLAGGRDARTHYRVLEELGDYSLIEARLETGRTHQIRVHLAYKQRPVLGDPTYGPRRSRAGFGLQRQFLHAYRLGFRLPGSAEWREFTCDLPADLEHALKRLRAAIPPR
jgi:23S rRNA pseudouridine1911/1915/1917 synthase